MMERSKAIEVTLRVRPEVARFAELMERKLLANDHKGHWRGSLLSYLIARLREECGELIDAVLYEEDSTPDHIAEEAADVANFAMFIADVAGALEVDTEDVGSTIQLNKNMYSVRDEIDMPVWRCPRCKDMSILEDFDFCPICTDPFSEVNDRYRLYCLAHGADSPEEMERIEADATGPGKPIFLLWATENMYEWKRLKGLKRDHVMTEADHAEFDSWLEAKVLGLGGDES